MPEPNQTAIIRQKSCHCHDAKVINVIRLILENMLLFSSGTEVHWLNLGDDSSIRNTGLISKIPCRFSLPLGKFIKKQLFQGNSDGNQ